MTLLENRTAVDAADDVDLTQAPAVAPAPPRAAARPRPRAVSSRTADDWLCLVGAVVSAVCLTWLLYTQVLPLSGKLGFVLVTFAIFLGIYSALTALTQPMPVVRDRLASALVQGAALVVLLALVYTIAYTFVRGYPAYKHLNFFTQNGAGPLDPLTRGGIKHAAIGTLIELGLAVAISLPLGVITAIYLVEIGGPFARIVRTVVEAMTALPDLVAGLFVYAFWILAFGFDRNGLAAALALSITMLPIIARSSDVQLRVVPSGLREASLALGASRLRTVWSVVLPTARSGLAGSLILGMARGIGETAPLLIVSTPTLYWETNPFSSHPMNSLSLFAINGLRQPDKISIERGYGAACVLLLVVVVLFVIVRLLARSRGTRPGLMRSLLSRSRTPVRAAADEPTPQPAPSTPPASAPTY